MPAKLTLKNKGIANDDKTAGFLLCNPALKLHAIEALNRCAIVI
jgi:hypothetical protein